VLFETSGKLRIAGVQVQTTLLQSSYNLLTIDGPNKTILRNAVGQPDDRGAQTSTKLQGPTGKFPGFRVGQSVSSDSANDIQTSNVG